MTIGDRLRQLREDEGLDQVQAAKVADTTKQAVSQIENGRTKVPGGLYLLKWARRYGVGLEWLITGKGDRRASQPVQLDGPTIISAYREASAKFAGTGLSAKSFKPLADPDHAGLLALAIMNHLSPATADSRNQIQVEVGSGSTRKDRAGSGAVGEDRAAEAGVEAESTSRRRRKSAA